MEAAQSFITNDRDYAPQKMNDLHKEILRRLIAGEKATVIADSLNCTTAVVGYVRHSPLGKEQLDRMHAYADMEAVDVKKRITELAPQALMIMEEIMHNPNAGFSTRRQVAESLLDRAGHGAVKQVQIDRGVLTTEDLNEIKSRARSMGILAEESVEAEVVSISTDATADGSDGSDVDSDDSSEDEKSV